jgi:hypothetical protein
MTNLKSIAEEILAKGDIKEIKMDNFPWKITYTIVLEEVPKPTTTITSGTYKLNSTDPAGTGSVCSINLLTKNGTP